MSRQRFYGRYQCSSPKSTRIYYPIWLIFATQFGRFLPTDSAVFFYLIWPHQTAALILCHTTPKGAFFDLPVVGRGFYARFKPFASPSFRSRSGYLRRFVASVSLRLSHRQHQPRRHQRGRRLRSGLYGSGRAHRHSRFGL